MKKIILLLGLIVSVTTQAQVTEIWTDYGGYWNSSQQNPNPGGVQPDNSHNLLAFRYNGTVYSTGVDDGNLTNNGVSYTGLTIRALPIASLPISGTPISGNPYFVALGQIFDGIDDGVDNSSSSPFQAITSGKQAASFLTRGEQGLDLGTGITNIYEGSVSRFNLSEAGITEDNIGDGVPDIIVSQIAQPTGGGDQADRLRFVDENGDVVGNVLLLDLTNSDDYPNLGEWRIDFYNINSTQTSNPGAYVNTTRGIRMAAFDIDEFGIDASNAGDAVALEYVPRGVSDPAFIAFNEPTLGVAEQLAIIQQPTTSGCDGSLPSNIQIQLQDENGFAVPQDGFEIEVEIESGAGELLGTLTQTTDNTGAATFDDLEFSLGGDHRLRFSFANLTDAVSGIIQEASSCNDLIWTGDVNSDWDNTGNWSTSEVPNANNNVTIPNGRPNYPVLNVDAGVNELIMESQASVDLGGFTFVIGGNLNVSNGASLTGSLYGSELYLSGVGTTSGDVSQTIPSGFITGQLANLTIDNVDGVNMNSDVNLTEVLEVKSGSTLTIDSASTFTFKSSAGKTAVVNDINGGNIVGCVTIERYIPGGRRAFRYLGSPVETTVSCTKPTINDNLQEGVNMTDPETTINPVPGYGTHITGSTSGANGFDATLTGNPSMFYWSAANQNWNAVPNTNSTGLEVGESFGLMVRGDRSIDMSIDNEQFSGGTTLRFTGELQIGDYSIPSSELATASGDYSLIANPYQAQVDLKTILQQSATSSGLSGEFIYIWDPRLNDRGGYAAVDLNFGSNGVSTPSGSEANKYLQPNQAFFVRNTSSNPSIIFKEGNKRKNNFSNLLNTFSDDEPGESGNDHRILMTMKLKKFDDDLIYNELKVKFHANYTNEVDHKDAPKIWNDANWFALENDDNYLAIESRTIPTDQDTIDLYIGALDQDEYELNLNLNNFEDADVYLEDTYTGTVTEITDSNFNYPFTVDQSIVESAEGTRFRITFDNVNLSNEVFESHESFKLFPNPTSDQRFSIVLPNTVSQDVNVEIYDLLGQNVYSDTFKSDSGRIDIEAQNLNSGVYLVKVNSNSGQTTKKLIVK